MPKLKLSYPVTPYGLNQGWGENGAYYRANGINVLGHNGLDLRAYHGQPVYAAHDGIAYYETDGSAGHGIVIVTDQTYDYKEGQAYFKTIYWHFADPAKEPQYDSPLYVHGANSGVGTPVKRGDQIGWADSTGFSGGDHLHFGLKPIRPGTPPTGVVDAVDVGIGNWVNIEGNNGYTGAIDPTPYLPAPPFIFNRDLFLGSSGEDVKYLQENLNEMGFTVSTTGAGSPGNETFFYGPRTVSAVARYQHSKGILPAFGFFGIKTRTAINSRV